MFGQAVMAGRQRLGLTQEELANRTGLSVRTIRNLEAGRGRVPRPASVRLLADAFGLRGTEREDFHRLALGSAAATASVEARRPVRVVPAQLPADVPGFTGRKDELSTLDGLPAGAVAAISGTAGVGKPDPEISHTNFRRLNPHFVCSGASK